MLDVSLPGAITSYFPPPRPELLSLLQQGDGLLDGAMGSTQTICIGRVLVSAGSPETPLYRLTSGALARIKWIEDGRRQILTIYLPGDLLAVRALLFERQADNIECLSSATVRVLDRHSALALAAQQPGVAVRLMWQLAENQRRMQNIATLLGRGTAVERISAALIDLHARQALIGLGTAPISLRQQDLADYIGLTLVHVNRTLRSLRDQGVISTRHRRIFVQDLAALHERAAPMLDLFQRARTEFGGSHYLSR